MPETERIVRLADFVPAIYREARRAKAERRRFIDRKSKKLVNDLPEFKNSDEPTKCRAAQVRRGMVSQKIREEDGSANGLGPDAWQDAVARITAVAGVTAKELEDWASRIVLNAPPPKPHVTKTLARLDRQGFSALLLRDVHKAYPALAMIIPPIPTADDAEPMNGHSSSKPSDERQQKRGKRAGRSKLSYDRKKKNKRWIEEWRASGEKKAAWCGSSGEPTTKQLNAALQYERDQKKRRQKLHVKSV